MERHKNRASNLLLPPGPQLQMRRATPADHEALVEAALKCMWVRSEHVAELQAFLRSLMIRAVSSCGVVGFFLLPMWLVTCTVVSETPERNDKAKAGGAQSVIANEVSPRLHCTLDELMDKLVELHFVEPQPDWATRPGLPADLVSWVMRAVTQVLVIALVMDSAGVLHLDLEHSPPPPPSCRSSPRQSASPRQRPQPAPGHVLACGGPLPPAPPSSAPAPAPAPAVAVAAAQAAVADAASKQREAAEQAQAAAAAAVQAQQRAQEKASRLLPQAVQGIALVDAVAVTCAFGPKSLDRDVMLQFSSAKPQPRPSVSTRSQVKAAQQRAAAVPPDAVAEAGKAGASAGAASADAGGGGGGGGGAAAAFSDLVYPGVAASMADLQAWLPGRLQSRALESRDRSGERLLSGVQAASCRPLGELPKVLRKAAAAGKAEVQVVPRLDGQLTALLESLQRQSGEGVDAARLTETEQAGLRGYLLRAVHVYTHVFNLLLLRGQRLQAAAQQRPNMRLQLRAQETEAADRLHRAATAAPPPRPPAGVLAGTAGAGVLARSWRPCWHGRRGRQASRPTLTTGNIPSDAAASAASTSTGASPSPWPSPWPSPEASRTEEELLQRARPLLARAGPPEQQQREEDAAAALQLLQGSAAGPTSRLEAPAVPRVLELLQWRAGAAVPMTAGAQEFMARLLQGTRRGELGRAERQRGAAAGAAAGVGMKDAAGAGTQPQPPQQPQQPQRPQRERRRNTMRP
ncbi:hypothetical protein CHLRE_03g146427v5 [Chlamydomonas reinhardtii]|uniref:Uncharacterized protein n=1 Tax=Chlamydomonas reinhardtii TaxID=3055 RepID=A0A2K3DVG1_CHLRE|nr:uncharacterized protein CHLRE_03g146427v5 [Chlamydomonas reinhardtii]PNW84519.1 hypothetical protein CHLRE_03g146427v5 [Chlamydomonas reinhardtii]